MKSRIGIARRNRARVPSAPRTVSRRLISDRSGATMVEFALAGIPFLLLLFATFEIGFVYWANKELENAINDAARLVRTGQAQAVSMTQADLKRETCNRVAILVDCNARLRLDVRSAADFADIEPPSATNDSGGLKSDSDFSYSPGAADQAVLVTAFFDWPALFQGARILRASTPLRNEPF